MFDMGWVSGLDGDTACDAVAANHQARLQADATQLYLAAHWANLHNGDPVDARGRVLPGMERAKQLGGPGTPRVAEFATAELGALQGIGYVAADLLVLDALDLRHRHPLLWAALGEGGVCAWQARIVAKLAHTAGLSLDQARWVDEVTTPRLVSLPWGRFLAVVEAKIIQADSDAAEARRVAAAMERFVRTGACNEYGLKTIIAKATAGDAIHFLAMVDRIAQILALQGDTNPIDVRRSTAIGIIAHPARAYTLLQHHATKHGAEAASHSDRDKGAGGDQSADDDAGGDAAGGCDGANDGAGGRGAGGELALFDGAGSPAVKEGDVHPSQNDADDPAPEQHPCPACAGNGTVTGDPSVFVQPLRVDPAKLLPPAVLYLHLSQDSFTRQAGVARFEGIGPITVPQAREFLQHCNVSVKPVIDLADQVPVDAYEVPDPTREALHLRNPADIIAYGTNLSRNKDADHTVAYLPPDQAGPPGQTNMANLGLLSRFPHRLKTHGRWQLRQPEPGTYLWRSPHGHHWLVDHNGTHPLGNRTMAKNLWATAGHAAEFITADDIAVEYEPPHVAA